MFRRVEQWLTARRFKKLSVAPYEPRIEAVRAKHAAGIKALRAEQKARLEAALAGAGR